MRLLTFTTTLETIFLFNLLSDTSWTYKVLSPSTIPYSLYSSTIPCLIHHDIFVISSSTELLTFNSRQLPPPSISFKGDVNIFHMFARFKFLILVFICWCQEFYSSIDINNSRHFQLRPFRVSNQIDTQRFYNFISLSLSLNNSNYM